MISELYSEKLVGYERTDGIGLEKSLIQKRISDHAILFNNDRSHISCGDMRCLP